MWVAIRGWSGGGGRGGGGGTSLTCCEENSAEIPAGDQEHS